MGEAASILIICLMAATLFVMAEMALASASKPKLRSKAKHGSRGAKAALQLIQQPSLYLSTVQIGITFTGISSAIFAGGPLSTELAARLESQPWLGGHAMLTAEFAVSFAIGSITIIFAELVPKRIALSRPETVAIWLSVPLSWLAWLAHPLVRILGWTADKVLSAIGCESISADEITSDELRSMVETSHASGHLSPSGKRIMLGALTLREITVAQVMTPAPRIVWLDLEREDEENWRRVISSGHIWFPVRKGSPDDFVGVTSVSRLWANLALTKSACVKDVITEALVVRPETTGQALLDLLLRSGQHLALVTDEFGRVLGVVTVNDLLEELVGLLPAESPPAKIRRIITEPDGSWSANGDITIEELRLSTHLPLDVGGADITSAASVFGLLTGRLGRLPMEGDSIVLEGLRIKVIRMDGHRIDRIHLYRIRD